MNGDKIFVDTNVLVYTVDHRDSAKQVRAIATMAKIKEKTKPIISTQVLQEFYSAATAKVKIDKSMAKKMTRDLRHLETVQVTPDLIERGIDISIVSQLSFWDGMIIAAAEFARCATIISEDLNDGQIIHGIKIINPFIAEN